MPAASKSAANASSKQVAIQPSRAEFLKLARTHTLVPVVRRVTADLETPGLRLSSPRLG